MNTFAEITQIEQSLNTWVNNQNNPEEYTTVSNHDSDNSHLPKQGVDYSDYMLTLDIPMRKAFLTDLSFREPASFRKTAHAMYGTEKSCLKDDQRHEQRLEAYEGRISEIRRIRNELRHYRNLSNRGEFHIYLKDRNRKISVDSRKWKKNGLFNSTGRARNYVKKFINDIDDVRLSSSWVENHGTQILVFAILPKMDAPSKHIAGYEGEDKKAVYLTHAEVEEKILSGAWDDEDDTAHFTNWGGEDLDSYRHDGRNEDKNYRKFHDNYDKKYHGSMQLDSDGEETWVTEEFFIEKEDVVLERSLIANTETTLYATHQ